MMSPLLLSPCEDEPSRTTLKRAGASPVLELSLVESGGAGGDDAGDAQAASEVGGGGRESAGLVGCAAPPKIGDADVLGGVIPPNWKGTALESLPNWKVVPGELPLGELLPVVKEKGAEPLPPGEAMPQGELAS